MFLGQDFCSNRVFECPNEVTKVNLSPLHIKAPIEGKFINEVLNNGGTIIMLLPKSMLEKFGKGNKDMVKTNVTMTYYNGKSTTTKVVHVEYVYQYY